MASEIDFAIAVGVFFLFVVVIINFLIGYITGFSGLTSTSEFRSDAFAILNALSNKGIPSDWWNRSTAPVGPGILDDLFIVPVMVSDVSGNARTNYSINFTVTLDAGCNNNAWENTIRVFNASQNEFAYTLYNKTYCLGSYLNKTDFAINVTFPSISSRIFFVYFSGDTRIANATYSNIPFPATDTTYAVKIFPTQNAKQLSYARLVALRNSTYDTIRTTLGSGFRFQIEVADK